MPGHPGARPLIPGGSPMRIQRFSRAHGEPIGPVPVGSLTRCALGQPRSRVSDLCRIASRSAAIGRGCSKPKLSVLRSRR